MNQKNPPTFKIYRQGNNPPGKNLLPYFLPTHLVFLILGNCNGDRHDTSQENKQQKMKMREMKCEDYIKVEESLQHHFHSVESENWKKTLNSLGTNANTTFSSINQQSICSEEDFFSMTDFPLPALGQPTLLGAVKQHNISCNTNEVNLMSPSSPRSTLSNISLGGSSGSLGSKGKT